MKGLFIFLALAVLVILGLWYLGQTEHTVQPVEPLKSAAAGATPRPGPPKKNLLPPPPPAPAATFDLNRAKQIAQEMRVELIGFTPQGAGGVVAVRWRGARTDLGMNYIERLIREGLIRDFSMDKYVFGAAPGPNNEQGYRMSMPVKF